VLGYWIWTLKKLRFFIYDLCRLSYAASPEAAFWKLIILAAANYCSGYLCKTENQMILLSEKQDNNAVELWI
jgi:hypothetical protein